jgi:hypothetical protein
VKRGVSAHARASSTWHGAAPFFVARRVNATATAADLA